MTTKNTSIRFDESLHERLVDYSTITHRSVSSVVEEAVATYLAEKHISNEEVDQMHQFMDRFQPLMDKLKDR